MKTHMITVALLVIAIILAFMELMVPALIIAVIAGLAEFAGWIKLFKSLHRLAASWKSSF